MNKWLFISKCIIVKINLIICSLRMCNNIPNKIAYSVIFSDDELLTIRDYGRLILIGLAFNI